MKEFIGLIKCQTEGMSSLHNHLLVKFSDDLQYFAKWHLITCPKGKLMIVKNDVYLQEFFEDFEDPTPVTPEEIERAQRIWDEFKKFMDTD